MPRFRKRTNAVEAIQLANHIKVCQDKDQHVCPQECRWIEYYIGDWLVFDDKELFFMKSKDFHSSYIQDSIDTA